VWDRESLLEELASRCGADALTVAQRIFAWFDAHDPALGAWFGRGARHGSFFPIQDLADGRTLLPFALWTGGQVEIQFQHISVPPFDDVDGRRPLLDRLNAVDGVTIDASRLTKRPSFSIATLAVGDRLDRFLEAIDWAYAEASTAARRG